eukprot:g17350.t1
MLHMVYVGSGGVEQCARYCGGTMNVPGSTQYTGGTNATDAPYVYFAVQHGTQCFCSNDLVKAMSLGTSTACNVCNGNADDQAKGLQCGGWWANSVYEIRVDKHKWTTRASQNWESLARPNVFTTISGRSDAKDVAALTRDDLALSYSGDRVTLTRHGNIEAEDKNMVYVGCRTKAAFKFTNVDVELGTEGERFLNEQLADKQRVITATLKGEKTERTVHRMERQGVRSKNPGLVFELDTSQVGEKLEVQAFLMVPQNREDMKNGNCRLEMTKVDGEEAEFPRCYSVSLYESNQLDHFKAGLTMLKNLATEYASQLQGDPQEGHAGNEMVEFHMHTDGGFVVKLNRMEIAHVRAKASPKDPVLVVWCGGHWYRTCFTRADPDDWAKKPLSAVATEDDDKQIQSLKLVRASSREGYTSRDVNAFRKQKHAAEAFGSAVSDKGMVLFVTLQTYWVENGRSFDENGLPNDHLDTAAEMKMPREQIGDLGKAQLKFGAVRISKHAKVTQVAEDAAGYKGPKTCAELWKARGGDKGRGRGPLSRS